MVVMGSMNYIIKEKLTTFEQDLIKELNKQHLDAFATFHNREFMDIGETIDLKVATMQFNIKKIGETITIRAGMSDYREMYNIEVLVAFIKNFAKDKLNKEIEQLLKKQKQFD